MPSRQRLMRFASAFSKSAVRLQQRPLECRIDERHNIALADPGIKVGIEFCDGPGNLCSGLNSDYCIDDSSGFYPTLLGLTWSKQEARLY